MRFCPLMTPVNFCPSGSANATTLLPHLVVTVVLLVRAAWMNPGRHPDLPRRSAAVARAEECPPDLRPPPPPPPPRARRLEHRRQLVHLPPEVRLPAAPCWRRTAGGGPPAGGALQEAVHLRAARPRAVHLAAGSTAAGQRRRLRAVLERRQVPRQFSLTYCCCRNPPNGGAVRFVL
jgi:hypothetical protein